MKVTSKEDSDSSRKRRHESIVTAWQALERSSLGAGELVAIQGTLNDESISPAENARELSREGVELRHPEVINCDARWRAAQVEKQAMTFAGISPLQRATPLKLKEAELALAELERLRCSLAREEITLSELNSLAVACRKILIKHAEDSRLPQQVREVQAEIGEWLRVWLETPNHFSQRLEAGPEAAPLNGT